MNGEFQVIKVGSTEFGHRNVTLGVGLDRSTVEHQSVLLVPILENLFDRELESLQFVENRESQGSIYSIRAVFKRSEGSE